MIISLSLSLYIYIYIYRSTQLSIMDINNGVSRGGREFQGILIMDNSYGDLAIISPTVISERNLVSFLNNTLPEG